MIDKDTDFVLDRSLNGKRLLQATGYVAPSWPELLVQMHDFYKSGYYV